MQVRSFGTLSIGSRGWLRALLFVVPFLAAQSAAAATLPFSGSFTILIGSYGIGVPGGGTATVNGSGSGGHLDSIAIPAGAFAANALAVSVTTPAAYPVAGIQLTASNGAGSFAKPGPGAIPILGAAKVCLFGPCSNAVANLNVPLSVVGAGGSNFATGAVNLTVVGAPWTDDTAAVGASTAMGFAHGPASQTSSTAAASGALQLVTPIFISTNLGGDVGVIPAFGVLNLHFVPEPTTLLLLGAGIAATAVFGRR